MTWQPKWLELARADLGVAEISGPSANPRVMAYFEAAGADWATDDAVPWCGAAMAAWVSAAGYTVPPQSARARAWLEWGTALDAPKVGCVVVFQRGKSEKTGHVALLVEDRGDRLLVLGGNQGNAVSITGFPKRDVLGYRWPAGAPMEPPPVSKVEGSRKVAISDAASKTAVAVGAGTAATEVATRNGLTLNDWLPLIKQFASDHSVLLIVGGCFFGLLVTEAIKYLTKQDLAEGRYTPSGGAQ